MSDKRALRARMRAIRDGFAGPPLALPRAFRDRLRPGLVVASYAPTGGEIDPAALAAAAVAAGCRIALPHVIDRATPLRFLAAGAVLHPGPLGLRQPHAEAAVLAPDIVLTPLVAFDRAGNRLGQGAGHYDRAFVDHPHAWRVGVAWSVQEVDALPAEAWDVPLHAIVTETEWIEPVAPKS
ncbi:5-formyltetrahydrofolate cyclo-ligase [Sphingomonas sp.]|jgi:5-formyltetrahydrofolate cyclo-ligase|uniref:5-formyltetrahydrofolate cyclo-ligase n=1 Tax=Sphingomonas sp. TaxID=28214 RepID=UPI002ED959DE